MPGNVSRLLIAFCAFALCLTGCGRQQPITTNIVPVTRQRMLAAIVKHGPSAWIFKISGPVAAMKPVVGPFHALLTSIKFDDGPDDPPKWTLPEGWKAEPPSGLRFATLKINKSQPPLEVSVMRLPVPPAIDWDTALLMNVNRWRKQLDQYDLQRHELATETTDLPLSGGLVATLADIVGTPEPVRPKEAVPKTVEPPSMPAPVSRPPKSSAGDDLPFTFKAPAEWTKKPNGVIAVATYAVEIDSKTKIEITITPSGGELLDNLNRWRNQVGLPPAAGPEMAKDAKQFDVDSHQGLFVRLVGEKETILGVMMEGDDTTWFFKLRGDKGLAEREGERFEAFVKSVKFR